MMNKKLLLILAVMPLIAGCTTSYTPIVPFPGDPDAGEEPGGGGGEGDDPGETNLIVNFYVHYSKSDLEFRLYTMEWWAYKPLGELPEQAVITSDMCPDPLYPTFLGYSKISSCLDETGLWNFETDYEVSNTLNLYGVWVAK